jgi:hypothetical protein
MMATPVNTVSSGGSPVSISTVGGTPVTEGLPGRGTPVTIVASGGAPVVYVDADPPAFQSAAVTDDGDTITVSFTDILDPSSVPDLTDFVVDVEGVDDSPTSITIDLDTVIFGVATITPGDTVLLSYTPGTNPLLGLTGVEVPAFTDSPVSNP